MFSKLDSLEHCSRSVAMYGTLIRKVCAVVGDVRIDSAFPREVTEILYSIADSLDDDDADAVRELCRPGFAPAAVWLCLLQCSEDNNYHVILRQRHDRLHTSAVAAILPALVSESELPEDAAAKLLSEVMYERDMRIMIDKVQREWLACTAPYAWQGEHVEGAYDMKHAVCLYYTLQMHGLESTLPIWKHRADYCEHRGIVLSHFVRTGRVPLCALWALHKALRLYQRQQRRLRQRAARDSAYVQRMVAILVKRREKKDVPEPVAFHHGTADAGKSVGEGGAGAPAGAGVGAGIAGTAPHSPATMPALASATCASSLPGSGSASSAAATTEGTTPSATASPASPATPALDLAPAATRAQPTPVDAARGEGWLQRWRFRGGAPACASGRAGGLLRYNPAPVREPWQGSPAEPPKIDKERLAGEHEHEQEGNEEEEQEEDGKGEDKGPEEEEGKEQGQKEAGEDGDEKEDADEEGEDDDGECEGEGGGGSKSKGGDGDGCELESKVEGGGESEERKVAVACDPDAKPCPRSLTDATISEVYKAVAKLLVKDVHNKREGAQSLRLLLSVERDPPIDCVIEAGGIDALLGTLRDDVESGTRSNAACAITNIPSGTDEQTAAVLEDIDALLGLKLSDDVELDTRLNAAWAITNIASGTHEQTAAVVEAGGVPVLVGLLRSAVPELREQAARGLGNIAGDCTEMRLKVLATDAPEATVAALGACEYEPHRRVIVWAMKNYCRADLPDDAYERVACLLPAFAEAAKSEDPDIAADAFWGLTYMSSHRTWHPRMLRQTPLDLCAQACISRSRAPLSVQPALRTIGEFASSDDRATQAVVDSGCVQPLISILQDQQSHDSKLRKEAAWILSNIAAGTFEQATALVDAGGLRAVVSRIRGGDVGPAVLTEYLWVLANVAHTMWPRFARQLYEEGVLAALAEAPPLELTSSAAKEILTQVASEHSDDPHVSNLRREVLRHRRAFVFLAEKNKSNGILSALAGIVRFLLKDPGFTGNAVLMGEMLELSADLNKLGDDSNRVKISKEDGYNPEMPVGETEGEGGDGEKVENSGGDGGGHCEDKGVSAQRADGGDNSIDDKEEDGDVEDDGGDADDEKGKVEGYDKEMIDEESAGGADDQEENEDEEDEEGEGEGEAEAQDEDESEGEGEGEEEEEEEGQEEEEQEQEQEQEQEGDEGEEKEEEVKEEEEEENEDVDEDADVDEGADEGAEEHEEEDNKDENKKDLRIGFLADDLASPAQVLAGDKEAVALDTKKLGAAISTPLQDARVLQRLLELAWRRQCPHRLPHAATVAEEMATTGKGAKVLKYVRKKGASLVSVLQVMGLDVSAYALPVEPAPASLDFNFTSVAPSASAPAADAFAFGAAASTAAAAAATSINSATAAASSASSICIPRAQLSSQEETAEADATEASTAAGRSTVPTASAEHAAFSFSFPPAAASAVPSSAPFNFSFVPDSFSFAPGLPAGIKPATTMPQAQTTAKSQFCHDSFDPAHVHEMVRKTKGGKVDVPRRVSVGRGHVIVVDNKLAQGVICATLRDPYALQELLAAVYRMHSTSSLDETTARLSAKINVDLFTSISDGIKLFNYALKSGLSFATVADIIGVQLDKCGEREWEGENKVKATRVSEGARSSHRGRRQIGVQSPHSARLHHHVQAAAGFCFQSISAAPVDFVFGPAARARASAVEEETDLHRQIEES